MLVSCTAYAALASFILVYLLNIKNSLKGFFIGAVIGILVSIMTDTYWLATSNFYSNAIVVLLDILGAGITVGSMGLLVTYTNKTVK